MKFKMLLVGLFIFMSLGANSASARGYICSVSCGLGYGEELNSVSLDVPSVLIQDFLINCRESLGGSVDYGNIRAGRILCLKRWSLNKSSEGAGRFIAAAESRAKERCNSLLQDEVARIRRTFLISILSEPAFRDLRCNEDE